MLSHQTQNEINFHYFQGLRNDFRHISLNFHLIIIIFWALNVLFHQLHLGQHIVLHLIKLAIDLVFNKL